MLLALATAQAAAPPALALCGFYVGRSDTPLFNRSSKVVLAHHDGKTVLTMMSDYQGALEEFALVMPVPEVVERGQIHVTAHALVDHLDAYTAPRLLEEDDPPPCRHAPEAAAQAGAGSGKAASPPGAAHGIEIEARYTVGEYDITILSAAQSAGLADWLQRQGYRLPDGAERTLGAYLADGMRFFLARVNLEEQSKLGYSYLRPLQIAYESQELVLPIRLGMLNADGPQELLLFTLTRSGRTEVSDYRTALMSSDLELPLFVKEEFGSIYRDMFETRAGQQEGPTILLEYAWEMNACEPCVARPMSFDELRELGAFWILGSRPKPQAPAALADEVFVTRLHLRYDTGDFGADLRLRETANRTRFQSRYVLRHPWLGGGRCEAASTYLERLPRRFEREARTLARLTGTPIAEIRERMEAAGQTFDPAALAARQRRWWERLWQE